MPVPHPWRRLAHSTAGFAIFRTRPTVPIACSPTASRYRASRVHPAPERIDLGRTDGREKIAWILAVIFISWFAWIFYLLLAPVRRVA